MKRMTLMTVLAVTGSVVMAQEPGTPAPKAAVAPVVAPHLAPVSPASSQTATNIGSGRSDLAKIQAINNELGPIMRELQPHEKKLQETDPELKALVDKINAARQTAFDLENKRRELLDAKLSADPKIAPLVEKRKALWQTMQEMRAASPSGAAMRDYMTRPGARRMPPPMDGPKGGVAPALMPPPEKPAAQ